MTYTAKRFETGSTESPRALQELNIQKRYRYFWTIGNIDILNGKLLGMRDGMRDVVDKHDKMR